MRHAGCQPCVLSSSSVHTCCAVALMSGLLHLVKLSCGLSAAAFAQADYKYVQGHLSRMWLIYSAGAGKQNPIAIPMIVFLTLSWPGRMPKRQSMS